METSLYPYGVVLIPIIFCLNYCLVADALVHLKVS